MANDSDEEYDVTNKVLNDYLVEINADIKLDNDYSNIASPTPSTSTPPLPNETTNLNPVIAQLCFNATDLNDHFIQSADFINQANKQQLIEFILQVKTKFKNLSLNEFKRFLILNKIEFSLLLLVGFILNLTYLPFVYLISILVLFKLKLQLFNFLIEYSVRLVLDYLKLSNRIIHYLKEVHLIQLASKIRLQLDAKSSVSNFNDIDLINYPYRRLVFKHFKSHFNEINYLNKKQLDMIQPNLIDKEQFAASLNQNELGYILQSKNESELNRLSDFYSLNCLKSILKLNRYILNEMIHLNYLNKISLYLTESNLTQTLFKSFKLFVYLIEYQLRLIKFKSELNDLNDICMLIKQKDHNGSNELIKKAKPESHSNETENQLFNYARQTLLDCYQLRSCSSLESRKEIVELLKYDLEYCGLYLDKIVSKLEPVKSDKSGVNVKQTDLSLPKVELEQTKINEKPLIEEDVIYEAEIKDLVKDVENKQTSDSSDLLLLKETKLINKNLFYELKYALKSKRNEWSEREKKAKRIGNNETNCDDNAKDLFSMNDLTNHLLDNEAFKHKSMIKKKNRINKMEFVSVNGGNKYGENLDDKIKEENDFREFNPMSNALFLAEFMSKRNKFICDENIEEIQNDEIIYE